MITCRQIADERCDLPGSRIYGDDARAVVVPRRAKRLVRVGPEQTSSLETFLERDVDRRAVRLEDVVSPGVGQCGCRLAQGALHHGVLVEDEDVGRERIWLARERRLKLRFIVALAGQAMSGLEDKDLKSARSASLAIVVALIADHAKGDAGRE